MPDDFSDFLRGTLRGIIRGSLPDSSGSPDFPDFPGSPGAPDLQAALDTWRDWELPLTGRPEVIAPVPGGRTNRSYQLRAPGRSTGLLLRLNNPHGEQLGICRNNEMIILQTVAAAGLTRGACYWSPEHRFTVFPYIRARTWSATDFHSRAQQLRLQECMERVQQLQPETPRRSYVRYLDAYWQQLESAGAVDAELKRRWADFRPALEAFDQGDWQPVLTHHDLIPENVLEDGNRLYLIDWEYAAVGHPDIDRWCLDPALVQDPFIHSLMQWTNDLWERVLALQARTV